MTDHDAYVTGSVTRGMCVCGEPWCESDGGPCNFVAGNLEAISYEEFGRRTAKNPDRADFNRAVLAMGRLINYSKEMQHDAR